MTVMSTPYGTIMSTPFDPVMSATPSHLHQHHPPPLPLTAMPLRRRRSSKVGTPVNIRRTASTPNVRAAAMDPNPGPYGSGGKGGRNKLGYHRTSVACGKPNLLRLVRGARRRRPLGRRPEGEGGSSRLCPGPSMRPTLPLKRKLMTMACAPPPPPLLPGGGGEGEREREQGIVEGARFDVCWPPTTPTVVAPTASD